MATDNHVEQPAAFTLPLTLEAAKIAILPGNAYYVPDFISEEEEQAILEKVRYPNSDLSGPKGFSGLKIPWRL
jgi:hypothetical protein